MNQILIKILGIFIVTICCIIATYTDVKSQKIPNKLTFSTFLMGIVLLSVYFASYGIFNLYYYFSILVVFVFAYVLWYFGLWAGGDVKLFTALSTLLVPDVLSVIPLFKIGNIYFPIDLASFPIPTFILILNSILAIIPVILFIVTYKIFKEKVYLIDKLKKTLNFNEVLLSLNSILISYIIISQYDIGNVIIKLVLIILLSYALSRIMGYDIILYILSIVTFISQIFNSNLIVYMELFVSITLISVVKNIFISGIVKETLTNSILKTELQEGMILGYPLYQKDGKYFFDQRNYLTVIKDSLIKNNGGKLICGIKSGGLSKQDIELIMNNKDINIVPIKKGLTFAPFVLIGLFITFLIGNSYKLLIILLGML